MKEEGEKTFKQDKIKYSKKYAEIKLIDKYGEENDFYKSNEIYDFKDNNISLSVLSPVYSDYLDNNIIMKSKPVFNFTKERRDFFKFLSEELNNNNNIISICGPEGIGKTASILAYFKTNGSIYLYFYVNIKTLFECFKNKDINKYQKLILNELYHCISREKLKTKLKVLYEEINKNLNPILLIINIIGILELENFILIIDQFKTLYDDNYQNLQNLINNITCKNVTLLIISSINENDVKDSIISILKEGNKPLTFRLNYTYIVSLVVCNENDISLLDTKEQDILKKYGNTYSYYYKILEEKIKYSKEKKDEDFGDIF